MNKSAKPLLSYLLLTYNQEKYVREAVESAFAQNYSPLEIIISDDHSTDNTWEIIKELFNKYNGPHKVIINRNKQNLGIAQHVNKVMAIAKGELFIMAAGDDIATPQKTSCFYNTWAKAPKQIFALCSNYRIIDSYGKYLETRTFSKYGIDYSNTTELIKNYIWSGCSVAYSRKLLTTFGKIRYNSVEDRVLYNRACLLGNIYRINEPLIDYRLGGTSNSFNNLEKMLNHNTMALNGLREFFLDTKAPNVKSIDMMAYLIIKVRILHKITINTIINIAITTHLDNIFTIYIIKVLNLFFLSLANLIPTNTNRFY